MRRTPAVVTGLFALGIALNFGSTSGCGGSGGGSKFGPDGGLIGGGSSGTGGSSGSLFGGGGDDGGQSSGGTAGAVCPTGAQCDVSCPNGTTTSISGKVYDPAKKDGLYNITVYVPGGAAPAAAQGRPHGRGRVRLRRALQERRGRGDDDRRRRHVQAAQRAGGREHPARHPGRQVAARVHGGHEQDAVRGCAAARQVDVPAGHDDRGRTERQHARHRRLDGQRRHARVPDAPHRPAGQRVHGGRGRDGARPRVLRRQVRQRGDRRLAGEARDGERAREQHDPLGHLGRT